MGSYYRGYRAGRAAAEREQRKADYINSRTQTEKDFRAETGRDWNQSERLEFDRDWRRVHLDLPENPLSDSYDRWFFISCLALLFVVIPSSLALNDSPFKLIVAAALFILVIGNTLLRIYRYLQACKVIERIGEKAWREQEILRQEEQNIDPWTVNENVPWK